MRTSARSLEKLKTAFARQIVIQIPTTRDHTSSVKPVTLEYVLNKLQALPLNKSCGPDNIDNNILRTSAEFIALSITDIFNFCIKNGVFPNQWKQVIVVPIHKGHGLSKDNPSNYRPISLTSTLSKLFESIISSQFMQYLEENCLLNEN